VIIDGKSGTILGAHLLGGHAGDLINLFATAIRNKISVLELKTGIYVHPAATSDITYML
jgi:glutathione reductase (NADPH)